MIVRKLPKGFKLAVRPCNVDAINVKRATKEGLPSCCTMQALDYVRGAEHCTGSGLHVPGINSVTLSTLTALVIALNDWGGECLGYDSVLWDRGTQSLLGLLPVLDRIRDAADRAAKATRPFSAQRAMEFATPSFANSIDELRKLYNSTCGGLLFDPAYRNRFAGNRTEPMTLPQFHAAWMKVLEDTRATANQVAAALEAEFPPLQ